MSMIWTPRTNIRKLENDIRSLFSEFDMDNARFALPIDMKENEEAYEINADLPGFNKDEIDIEASGQYLQIRAEKKSETEDKKDDYVVKERSTRSYTRRINFDKMINPKACEVMLSDGVLYVKLPKAEEAKTIKLSPK
ncbi:MAG: Hsp20/alpha crystallin family protein [Candidatus Heimdallarchaeota archaeon]|nr:Hsp20/alpha crystallin family protein [Candidatus Heimdallarchaeota archaeon]